MDAERRGQLRRSGAARSVPLVQHRAAAWAGEPDGRRQLVVACVRPAPVDAEQRMAEAAGAGMTGPGRAATAACRPLAGTGRAPIVRVEVVVEDLGPGVVPGERIAIGGRRIGVRRLLPPIVLVFVLVLEEAGVVTRTIGRSG